MLLSVAVMIKTDRYLFELSHQNPLCTRVDHLLRRQNHPPSGIWSKRHVALTNSSKEDRSVKSGLESPSFAAPPHVMAATDTIPLDKRRN
eukprot:scaffold20085_cov187-Skeletonema_marinoi.AAC.2